MLQIRFTLSIVFLLTSTLAIAEEIPTGREGFKGGVQQFLAANCIRCHGVDKKKGDIALDDLKANWEAGSLKAGEEVERWELVLDMLESGEMPPEGEPQPDEGQRKAVVQWIESGLREYVDETSRLESVPTARRLTNIEYENTIRDLIGFHLQLIDDLPKDPVKPYKFNNTAEFMLMGREQVDRYLECARRVMASAIVDPEKPEVHLTRREWQPHGLDRGLGADEIGVWGNRRNTPASGMGLKSFPKTGEYRIRVKAAAILPPGTTELPLRLVMGYNLGENSATLQVETVGTVRLTNDTDHPEVFEFRGRMENHPPRPGRMVKGKRQPETMAITPQNLYDDGTLNDGRRDLAMPRAVVEWIEFEAPVVDDWPPEYHKRILFDSPLRESDPPQYVRAVLKRFMSRAYRRPATDDEIERFVRIYDLVSSQVDSLEAAMRETLAMVLVSPQFMYHTVANESSVTSQFELASRLSYFLWASMPDEELLRLAEQGKLDEPSEIKKQVQRLLADERSQDFVVNFTNQWLSLEKLTTVPINRELFPRFLYYVGGGERAGTEVPYRPTVRDYMLQETRGFIGELIRRNASVLNIVDSDFAFLNQRLAVHYGISGVQGHELRPVKVKPEDHLGGLLTHGSILIGNGTGSAPHPIYRAVWLREAILGDEVPPPPADVPALSDSAGESADTATTIKDLLRQHRQKESCNDCHVRLDPWGIPFERYNAIGRFQPLIPKEGTRVSRFDKNVHKDMDGYNSYLKTINTVEVEASSRVPHGPEVDGIAQLKSHLLKERKEDIAENVLRRLLSYGIGRELDYRDRFAIEELMRLAESDGYTFQNMIVSICQSSTFRTK